MSDAVYDPVTGIITLTSAGLHTAEEISQRARMVERLVDASKSDRGYARILNFAHDLPVQTVEVAEKSVRQTQDHDRMNDPRDKFAIVISSALGRMQMTRILGSAKRRVFATDEEARAWLLED